MRTATASALLCFLICSVSSAKRPSHEEMARAKQLFMTGKDSFEKKRFSGALVSFQASLKLVERHSTILWMGHCRRNMNQPNRALARYEQFIRMVEGGVKVDASVSTDVRAIILELRPQIMLYEEGKRQNDAGKHAAALEKLRKIAAHTSWVDVRWQLARSYLGLSRYSEALTAIKAVISFQHKRVQEWKDRHPDEEPPHLKEAMARLRDLDALKAEIETAASKRAGSISLRGLPRGARVRIDGVAAAAAATARPIKHAPGTCRLHVAAAGFAPWQKVVTIEPGQVREVAVVLTPIKIERSNAWLAATISSAALALGFEVAAWIGYSQMGGLSSGDGRYGTFETLTLTGHILAGVFAAATGFGYYMFHRSGRPAERASSPSIAIVPARDRVVISGAITF